MNEILPPSESNQSTSQPANPAAQQAAPSEADAKGRSRYPLIPVALSVLTVLLVASWWTSHNALSSLREEVARRLLSGDSINNETKIVVKTAQESLKELQAKVNVLEGKQAEAQSQQLALEQLYQDLSKTRDDWALAEIEQVLSTASQQLQLAGNVPGALIALQNADARLSRSDKPQFITIRRAIGKDMERLKLLPSLDLTGIALRLDSVITQIDAMPLLADEKPILTPVQPRNVVRNAHKSPTAVGKAASIREGAPADWFPALQDKWQSLSSEMWTEVRQLIRVRNVESPDALLLSPAQAYYARENVKLRLLNARLALLSRNESAFRSDMIAAQDAIAKYFDTRAKQTQTVQALLKQVQGSNLSIEMPTLAESLNAVRNYKVKP